MEAMNQLPVWQDLDREHQPVVVAIWPGMDGYVSQIKLAIDDTRSEGDQPLMRFYWKDFNFGNDDGSWESGFGFRD